MAKKGRDSNRLRKATNIRNYNMLYAMGSLQYHVSKDVEAKKKSTMVGLNSPEDRESGFEWFNSGHSLEEAPEDMRNNVSFNIGFQRAQRIKLVNDTLYDSGREHFEKGFLLEECPENYRNNEYFIAGYESAMIVDKNQHRRTLVRDICERKNR